MFLLAGAALAVLGCSGGASLAIPPGPTGPPNPPTIALPVSGPTVGFPVTVTASATVKGGGPVSITYAWTIAPSTATFSGGSATATGATVTFTSSASGPVSLSCVATAGNVYPSNPGTASVTFSDPSTALGSFSTDGILEQGRLGLAAILLGNGSVLVTGGSASAGGAALSSTELYTPGSGPSMGPAMVTARTNHALAPIPGTTQVLVTGGGALPTGMASNPNAEIYDSGLNTFTASPNLMASNRFYHTATSVSPSSVFIAGGLTSAGVQVNTEEVYSIGAFSPAGTVALAPNHTATLLPSSTLLPSGGILLVSHSGSGSWTPFATIYNLATGTYTTPTNQPSVPREGHQAILLPGLTPPMVLILGGTAGSGPVASAEWFNTQTLTFSPVGEAMASPREDFGAALLGTGDVLLVGGTADGTVPVATAEIFDPVNVTFTPTGSMATPRMGPSVFALGDGTVLVLGGTAATPVERFTPAS